MDIAVIWHRGQLGIAELTNAICGAIVYRKGFPTYINPASNICKLNKETLKSFCCRYFKFGEGVREIIRRYHFLLD